MRALPFFCVLLAILLSTGILYAEDTDNWSEVEATQTTDNDDIAEKVAQTGTPSNLAVTSASSGKGIVWKKSTKTAEQESAEDEAAKKVVRGPEKTSNVNPLRSESLPKAATSTKTAPTPTTVKRPVIEPELPQAKLEDSQDTETFLLKSKRKVGATDLVETLLEVSGDVKQEKKTESDKMEVVAGFRYEERIQQFSSGKGPLSSVRQYNLAKAKMKIADDIRAPELEETLQTIVCKLDGDKVSLFSPKGSLRGEQLLLVEDLPGNTLTLDRLLPDREVKIGDTWPISESVLRSFLSIEAVLDHKVEAVLTAVADNMAMVELVGDVSGMYLGAATQMSIRGKFQFDLSIARINWLGLLIEENRSIGHVGPGLELVARLQVKISPVKAPQSLTDDVVKSIDTKAKDSVMTLKYDGGKGPWRFSHSRDWYVIQDDAQTTILRQLNRGELVAQCNIADMGRVDVNTMTSLSRFQKELSDGLGDNFGKIVAAEESMSPAGYKTYTVLIDGAVDDLPLRWVYHLLTDKTGRQTVIVFVVEANQLEHFGDSDLKLLDTYRMGR